MDSQLHIFDCDGVLISSNKLKTYAFKEVASKFVPKNLVEKFITFHKANGGVSRWEKFSYLKMISKDYDLPSLDVLADQFSNYVDLKLNNIKPIPGALEYIRKLFLSDAIIYVVSGGEQSQVRKILIKLKFDINEDMIFGSPIKKIKHFQNIRNKHPNLKIMTYGDSLLDAKCADHISSEFTYVSQDSEITENELTKNISFNYTNIKNFNYLI